MAATAHTQGAASGLVQLLLKVSSYPDRALAG